MKKSGTRRPTQVILICEDKSQCDFVRGFIEGRGYPAGKVFIHMSESGLGDAKSYVHEHVTLLCAEAKKQERKDPIYVIAVRDADTDDVERVRRDLKGSSGGHESFFSITPYPDIEAWLKLLEGVDSSVRTTGRRKSELGRRAFKLGYQFSFRCRNDDVPTEIRSSCESLADAIKSLKP